MSVTKTVVTELSQKDIDSTTVIAALAESRKEAAYF